MTPAKLDILFAFFVYAGNGGVAMQLPDITTWFAKRSMELAKDPRVGRVGVKRFGDVPLTMERNRVVRTAKDEKFDVIVMLDSDNIPDLYEGKTPEAKPFWETSFDFLYQRAMRGVPTVVCAPYCGPPPHPVNRGEENVYVFHAEKDENDTKHPGFKFTAYSRTHAAQMRGIQPIAAGPTGVIMYSTDAFDLLPVRNETTEQILDQVEAGTITKERAARLLSMQSWFWYEFTNLEQTQKASTEDVTNTREIQLAGIAKHSEPVVFCNWDAWAGHMKPKCVGKPEPIAMEQISAMYLEAMEKPISSCDARVQLDFAGADEEVETRGEDDTDISDEEAIIAGAEEIDALLRTNATKNGVAVVPRIIAGRKVYSVGHQTMQSELDALTSVISLLQQLRGDKSLRVVEVGTWVGESAIAMHAGMGPGGRVFCVDTMQGSAGDQTGEMAKAIGSEELKEWWTKNVGDLNGNGILLKIGESSQVARGMQPQQLDAVFIDGDHTAEGLRRDIDAWFRHVADDGFIIGHDWHPAFPDVEKTVLEWVEPLGVRVRRIENTSLWIVAKGDILKAIRDQSKEAADEPVVAES